MWEEFECKTLGEYHDLFLKKDVCLLADVFENFRSICLEQYGLDPAHYYSSPGLSWDALLKKTNVNLELLTDVDMHLFIEKGTRGVMSMVNKRYAKENNPYVKEHDPSKLTTYTQYLDANNLYGWAMSKALSKGGFKCVRTMPTEKEILSKKKEHAKQGWILEVDLEYPTKLHNSLNACPLAPEKKKMKRKWVSEYQRKLADELKVDMKEKKLMLTLQDKENYVLNYKNLHKYLKLGMKLNKVHRTLEFNQECWMEPYIHVRMNTEFKKQAKNDVEKKFYKLMNNSVFGKTMENLI